MAIERIEHIRAGVWLRKPELLETAMCLVEALDARKRAGKPRIVGEEGLRAAIIKAKAETL